MTLLLCPGFHKTGTTLMQTRVLPGLGLNYIGRSYGTDHEFLSEYRDEIEGHLTDLAQGTTRVSALSQLLMRLVQDEEVHILATENLLRPSSSGGFLQAVAATGNRAPAGRLGVLLTVRRQFDLIVSRYLHDLNIKHPRINRGNILGRAVGRLRRGKPPYSLGSAVDDSNPPCQWPSCSPSGGRCPCAENGQMVSITRSFYDFYAVYEALRESIPRDFLVVADLVDPSLREEGLERLCALLSGFGATVEPSELAAHFETPLNAQRGLTRAGFSREDLGEAEVARIRASTNEYYRAGNQKLAAEFPEFSAYLEPS